jgi:hypothetical protein
MIRKAIGLVVLLGVVAVVVLYDMISTAIGFLAGLVTAFFWWAWCDAELTRSDD